MTRVLSEFCLTKSRVFINAVVGRRLVGFIREDGVQGLKVSLIESR